MKKLRRFNSWEDAEVAERQASKERGILEDAVHALANNQVKWMQGLGHRVGMCKLDSASGGIVILLEGGITSARYLDEWYNKVLSIPAPTVLENQKAYRRWVDLQEIAAKVKIEQTRAMDLKYGAVAPGIPAEVQQG